MDIVARLARGDVNMPGYDGFPIHTQIPEVQFEAEVYQLLQSEPNILASQLLYHRLPVQHPASNVDRPKDIAGRRLLVFRRTEGKDNVRSTLNPAQKVRACINIAVDLFIYADWTLIVKPSCSGSSHPCITV